MTRVKDASFLNLPSPLEGSGDALSTQNLQEYQDFIELWRDPKRYTACLEAYACGDLSFIPRLLPELALRMPVQEILNLLQRRWGSRVDLSLEVKYTDPELPFWDLPQELRGPVAGEPNAGWLKNANLVGVNLRTTGGFWGLVPYCLTLPAAQNAIHLLPIWEPGVVGSLYGMCSWQINPEFYHPGLAEVFPWLNTPERQLKAVINLLHLMGRAVGMDVIPHTDRFSEMALAFPEHFEWLRRKGTRILDHSANLYQAVQKRIGQFLRKNGPAVEGEIVPTSWRDLFSPECSEARRLRLLFGQPGDYTGRLRRRKMLIRELHRAGYETVPATMAPPFRGLEVDPSPQARLVDEDGLEWRDYRFIQPQAMSRVFNPLAGYRLFESKEDNLHWELDFSRPRLPTWQYVCEHYAEVQRRFGFDFMRGDMSHTQMRPQSAPLVIERTYHLLSAVKAHIQSQAPYFGYFAESFLAGRDVMGYGDEMDHLEASAAEATLGDLQSTVVGSAEFLQRLRLYDDFKKTRRCKPSFTIITADKDDPRFDHFYLAGNELRLFMAFFLTDFPSYMGLGFETRDPHPEPAPNEHYTKLYVFREPSGPKATHGPYVWGKNTALFSRLERIKLYFEKLWPRLHGQSIRWLIAPDATGVNPLIAWTQQPIPKIVFLVNSSLHQAVTCFGLPTCDLTAPLVCEFTTADSLPETDRLLMSNGLYYPVSRLESAEGRAYRLAV